MCTALIMGAAQLGLGLATSYSKYKTQKRQLQTQRRNTQQAKQQMQKEQKIEKKIDEHKAREASANLRASLGASGVELSGSNADYLSQMGQDYNLNGKYTNLHHQKNLASKDYQLNNYQNNLSGLKNGFGYNVAGQILGGLRSL